MLNLCDWICDSYEGENGIVLKEVGAQRFFSENPQHAGSTSSGFYSYPGDDGVDYSVNWYADESGFHAFGDHLPTPPPMPAYVVRLLAKLAADQAL